MILNLQMAWETFERLERLDKKNFGHLDKKNFGHLDKKKVVPPFATADSKDLLHTHLQYEEVKREARNSPTLLLRLMGQRIGFIQERRQLAESWEDLAHNSSFTWTRSL